MPPLGFADLLPCEAASPGEFVSAYSLRFVVRDRPGIIADLARILADHGANIEAVFQEPWDDKNALPFVITLEPVAQSALDDALASIAGLAFHVEPPLALPADGLRADPVQSAARGGACPPTRGARPRSRRAPSRGRRTRTGGRRRARTSSRSVCGFHFRPVDVKKAWIATAIASQRSARRITEARPPRMRRFATRNAPRAFTASPRASATRARS